MCDHLADPNHIHYRMKAAVYRLQSLLIKEKNSILQVLQFLICLWCKRRGVRRKMYLTP